MRRALRYLSAVLALVFTVSSGFTEALAAPGDSASNPFVDVQGTEYAQSVSALYGLGVLSGVSEHAFGVSQPVTRAQMAAFLARATRLDKDGPVVLSTLFGDVPTGYWAYDAINKAALSGYISGYQGQFRPEDQVTEAEAVTMMLRALGYASSSLDYPVGYVLKARSVGLLVDSIPFSISATATRGWIAEELAQMVFTVPLAGTDQTLSQSKFQMAVGISLSGGDYLLPGDNALTLQGLDAYGKSFVLSSATWRVDSGAATVSATGVVNVTGAGVVNISATANGQTASKAYDVLRSLVATPAALSLQLGASAKVSVDGVTAGGKHYTVTPTLQVVSGPFTITSDGVIQATGTGNGVVRAALGSLTGDIPVVSASTLAVSPANLVLVPGQQQQFQVTIPGSTTPVDSGAVQWSVKGPGTISATGLFTAAAGATSPVVTAQVGALTASTTVKVLSSLQIQPAQAALTVGRDQTFTVNGVTSAGDTVPVPGATCTLSGNIGLLGSGCHMAAIAAGQGTLTATYAGLSAVANVSVSGQAQRLMVTPDKTSVPANGHSPVKLTVQVVDASGLPVPQGSNVVTLSLTPPTAGSLSSSQVALSNGTGSVTFTPSTQVSNVTVLAAVADGSLYAGTAQFNTYLPVPSQVQITAGPATMQAAASSWSTITATLLDTDGTSMPANTAVTVNLNLVGATIGNLTSTVITIQPGLSSGTTQFLTNGAVGSVNILGASPYPVTSTTLTTTTAGPAAKLHIRSGYATGTANLTTLPIYVEVQDANGVTRTADAGGVVSGALTCGTTTTNYTAAITSGVAAFQVQSRVAGNCTFTVSAPWLGAADSATVTFKAGQATQVLLSAPSGGNVSADGVSQTNLVAKIADAYGNLVTDGSWLVSFSKVADNQATTMPANTTVATVQGVATLSITGNLKVSSDIYTAAVLGLPTVGDGGTANVTISSRIYGVPTHLVITNVSNVSPTVGNSTTVSVAVEDANNYVRTQDNSTMVFLSSTTGAVITPAQQAVTGGVATFTVSDSKAENLALTASSGTLQSASTTVAYQNGQVSHITLTADATQLAADGVSQTSIRAQGTDQYGNVVPVGYSLNLSLSSNLGTLSNSVIYGGNFPVIFTAGTTPGTVTVSAAAGSGYSVDPLVIKLGIPGTPNRLAVVAPATVPASITPTVVKVQVYDTNGNVVGALSSGGDLSQIGLQITGASGNKTTVSNTGSGILSNYGYIPDGITRGAMPAVNGVASFNIADTNLETVTLTPIGYYKGVALQGQPVTLTVTAGVAAGLKITPAPYVTYNAASVGQVTFTVAQVDINGNVVVPATPDVITVTLSSTANFVNASPVSTWSTVNGMATITLPTKAGAYGTTTASVVSSQTGRSGTFSIIGDKIPDAPTVYAIDNTGSGTVIDSTKLGVKVTIVPTATYTNQTILATVNGQIVTLYTDTTFSTVLNSISAGSTGILNGYIKRSDLGGLGVKSIQVVLQNGLGTGAASTPVLVNVTP